MFEGSSSGAADAASCASPHSPSPALSTSSSPVLFCFSPSSLSRGTDPSARRGANAEKAQDHPQSPLSSSPAVSPGRLSRGSEAGDACGDTGDRRTSGAEQWGEPDAGALQPLRPSGTPWAASVTEAFSVEPNLQTKDASSSVTCPHGPVERRRPPREQSPASSQASASCSRRSSDPSSSLSSSSLSPSLWSSSSSPFSSPFSSSSSSCLSGVCPAERQWPDTRGTMEAPPAEQDVRSPSPFSSLTPVAASSISVRSPRGSRELSPSNDQHASPGRRAQEDQQSFPVAPSSLSSLSQVRGVSNLLSALSGSPSLEHTSPSSTCAASTGSASLSAALVPSSSALSGSSSSSSAQVPSDSLSPFPPRVSSSHLSSSYSAPASPSRSTLAGPSEKSGGSPRRGDAAPTSELGDELQATRAGDDSFPKEQRRERREVATRPSGGSLPSVSPAASHANADASPRLSRPPEDRGEQRSEETTSSIPSGTDRESDDVASWTQGLGRKLGTEVEELSGMGIRNPVLSHAPSPHRRPDLGIASVHAHREAEQGGESRDSGGDAARSHAVSARISSPSGSSPGSPGSVKRVSRETGGASGDSEVKGARPVACGSPADNRKGEEREQGHFELPFAVSFPTARLRQQPGRGRGSEEDRGDRTEADAEPHRDAASSHESTHSFSGGSWEGDTRTEAEPKRACGDACEKSEHASPRLPGEKGLLGNSPTSCESKKEEEPASLAPSSGGERASEESRFSSAAQEESLKQEGRFLSAENYPVSFSPPRATSQRASGGGDEPATSFSSSWTPLELRDSFADSGGPSGSRASPQVPPPGRGVPAPASRPEPGGLGTAGGRGGAQDSFYSPEASHVLLASASQCDGQMASAPTSSFHTPREVLTVDGSEPAGAGAEASSSTREDEPGAGGDDLAEFHSARGSRLLEPDLRPFAEAVLRASEGVVGGGEREGAEGQRSLSGGSVLVTDARECRPASRASREDLSEAGRGEEDSEAGSHARGPHLVESTKNGDAARGEVDDEREGLGREEEAGSRGEASGDTGESEEQPAREHVGWEGEWRMLESGRSAGTSCVCQGFEQAEAALVAGPPEDEKSRLCAETESELPGVTRTREEKRQVQLESNDLDVPRSECRSPVMRATANDSCPGVAPESLRLPVFETRAPRPSRARAQVPSGALSPEGSGLEPNLGSRRLSLASIASEPHRRSFCQTARSSDDGRLEVSPSPQTKRCSFLATSGDESVSSRSHFSGEESGGRQRMGSTRERERRRRGQEGQRYAFGECRSQLHPTVFPAYPTPGSSSPGTSPACGPAPPPRLGGSSSPPGEAHSPFRRAHGPMESKAISETPGRAAVAGLSPSPTGASPRTAPVYPPPGGDASVRIGPSDVAAQTPAPPVHGVSPPRVPFPFPQKLSPERGPSPRPPPFVGLPPQILVQQQQLFLQATAPHLRPGVASPPQTLPVAPQQLLVPVDPSLHQATLAASRPPRANLSPVEMNPVVPFLPFFPVDQSTPAVPAAFSGGGPGPAAPLVPVAPFAGCPPVPRLPGPTPAPFVVSPAPTVSVPPAPHAETAAAGPQASRGTSPGTGRRASNASLSREPIPAIHKSLQELSYQLRHQHQLQQLQHQLLTTQGTVLSDAGRNLPAFAPGRATRLSAGAGAPAGPRAPSAPSASSGPPVPSGLGPGRSGDGWPSQVEIGVEGGDEEAGEEDASREPAGGRDASPAQSDTETQPSGTVAPGQAEGSSAAGAESELNLSSLSPSPQVSSSQVAPGCPPAPPFPPSRRVSDSAGTVGHFVSSQDSCVSPPSASLPSSACLPSPPPRASLSSRTSLPSPTSFLPSASLPSPPSPPPASLPASTCPRSIVLLPGASERVAGVQGCGGVASGAVGPVSGSVPSSSYASPPHQVCRILLLSEQLLQQLLHHVTPTASARDEKRLLYNSLVHFVHNILGSEVSLYLAGSTAYDVDAAGSDLDVVLLDRAAPATDARGILQHLRSMIEAVQQQLAHAGESALGSDWPLRTVHLQLVDSARVPILTLRTPDASVVCDISVNTSNSIWHSEFFSFVLQQRPQLRPLMRLLKVWVRNRKLPTMKEGGLPSIVWMILAVYFCHGGQRNSPRRGSDQSGERSGSDEAGPLDTRETGEEIKCAGAQPGASQDSPETALLRDEEETGSTGSGASAHLVSPLGFLAPMVGLPAPILPSFFPLLLSLLQFFAHLRNRSCLSQSIFICCSPSGTAGAPGAFSRPLLAAPGEERGLRHQASAPAGFPHEHQALASSAILSGAGPVNPKAPASVCNPLSVGASSSPLLVSSVPKPRSEAAQRIISSFCHGGVWDDLLSVYDYPKTNAAYLHSGGPGGSSFAVQGPTGGSAVPAGSAGAGGGPDGEPAIDLAAKVSSATWLVYLYELGRAAHLLNSFLKAVNRFHLLLQILHSQAANQHLQNQLEHLRTLQGDAAGAPASETPSTEGDAAGPTKAREEGESEFSEKRTQADGEASSGEAEKGSEKKSETDAQVSQPATETGNASARKAEEKMKPGAGGGPGTPGSSPTFPFTQGLQLFRRDLLMGVAAIFDEISDDRYVLPATYEEATEEADATPDEDGDLLSSFLSTDANGGPGESLEFVSAVPGTGQREKTVEAAVSGASNSSIHASTSSAPTTGCFSRLPPCKGLSVLADAVRVSLMRPATLSSKVWLLAVLEGRLCVIESSKTCQEGGWWSTQFLSRRDVRSTLHGRLYLLVGLQPLQRYLLACQRRPRLEGRQSSNGPAEISHATHGTAQEMKAEKEEKNTEIGDTSVECESGVKATPKKEAAHAEDKAGDEEKTKAAGRREKEGNDLDGDVLSSTNSVFPLSYVQDKNGPKACALESDSAKGPSTADPHDEVSSFFSLEGHYPALLVPVNPETLSPPVLFSPCNFVTRLTVLQCGVPASLARPLVSLFPSLGLAAQAKGAKAPGLSLRVLPSWEMARVSTLHRIAATSPWFYTVAPRHQTQLHAGMRAPLQPTVARCRHCGVSGVTAVGGLLDQAEKELRDAIHNFAEATLAGGPSDVSAPGDRASEISQPGPSGSTDADQGNENEREKEIHREETRTLAAVAALTIAAERLETSSRTGGTGETAAGAGPVPPSGGPTWEERREGDRGKEGTSEKGIVRPGPRSGQAPAPPPGNTGEASGRPGTATPAPPGASGSPVWACPAPPVHVSVSPSPPYDSTSSAPPVPGFGAGLGSSSPGSSLTLAGKKGPVQNAATAAPVPRPPSGHLHPVSPSGPQHPLLMSPAQLGSEAAHAGQPAPHAGPGRGPPVSPVAAPAGIVPAPHLLPQPSLCQAPGVSTQPPHPPVVLLMPVTPQQLLIQHQQQLLHQQMLQQHYIQQQLAHVAAVAALNGAGPPGGGGALPPRVEHAPVVRPPQPGMPTGLMGPGPGSGSGAGPSAGVGEPGGVGTQAFEDANLTAVQRQPHPEKSLEKTPHAGFYYGTPQSGLGRSESGGGRGLRGAGASTGSAGTSRRGSQQHVPPDDDHSGVGCPGPGPLNPVWGPGPGSGSTGRGRPMGLHAGAGGHRPGFRTRSTASSGSPHGGRRANGDGALSRWGTVEERGPAGFLQEPHASRQVDLRVKHMQEAREGNSGRRSRDAGCPPVAPVSEVEGDTPVGSTNWGERGGDDGRLAPLEASNHRRSTGDLAWGSIDASGLGASSGVEGGRRGDRERGKGYSGPGRERCPSVSSLSPTPVPPVADNRRPSASNQDPPAALGETRGDRLDDLGRAGPDGGNKPGTRSGAPPSCGRHSSVSPSVSAGPGSLERANKSRVLGEDDTASGKPGADITGLASSLAGASSTESQGNFQATLSHAETSSSPSHSLTPAGSSGGAVSLHPCIGHVSPFPSSLSFSGAAPALRAHPAAPHALLSAKTDARETACGSRSEEGRDGRQATLQGPVVPSQAPRVSNVGEEERREDCAKSGRHETRQEAWASAQAPRLTEPPRAGRSSSRQLTARPEMMFSNGGEAPSFLTEASSAASRKGSDESFHRAGPPPPEAARRTQKSARRDSGDSGTRGREEVESGRLSPEFRRQHRDNGDGSGGYGDSGREGRVEKGRTRSVEGGVRLASPASSPSPSSPPPFDASAGSLSPASPSETLKRTDGPRPRTFGGEIVSRALEEEEKKRFRERLNDEELAARREASPDRGGPACVPGERERRSRALSPAPEGTSLPLRFVGEREETNSPQVPSSPSSKNTPTASTPSLSESGAQGGPAADSTSSTSSRRLARERIPLKHRAEKLLYVPGALRRQKLLGQQGAEVPSCGPSTGSASSIGQSLTDSPGGTGRDRGLAVPPLSPASSLQSCSSGGPPSSGDRERGSLASSCAGCHPHASTYSGGRDSRRALGSTATPASYGSPRTSSYPEGAATSPGMSSASSPRYPASRHESHGPSGVTGLFGYYASRSGSACSRGSSRDSSEGRGGGSVASSSGPASYGGGGSASYLKGAGRDPSANRERFPYRGGRHGDYDEGRKVHTGERVGGRGPLASQGIFAYSGASAFACSVSGQQRFAPYGRANGTSGAASGGYPRHREALEEDQRANYRTSEVSQGGPRSCTSSGSGMGDRGAVASHPGYPPSHQSFMSPKEALRTRHRVVEEVHWRLAHNARKLLQESSHGGSNLEGHPFSGSPATSLGSEPHPAPSTACSGHSVQSGGGYLASQKACSSPSYSFAEGPRKAPWLTFSAPAAVGPGASLESLQSPTPGSVRGGDEDTPRSRRDASTAYASPRDRVRMRGSSPLLDRSENDSDLLHAGRRDSGHEAHMYASSQFFRRGETSRNSGHPGPLSRTTSGGALGPSTRRRPTVSMSHGASPSFQAGVSTPASQGPGGLGARHQGRANCGVGGGTFASYGSQESQHSGSSLASGSSGMSKNGQARLLHAALNCAVGRSDNSVSSLFASSTHAREGGPFSSRNSEVGRLGGRSFPGAPGGERRLDTLGAAAGLESPSFGAGRDSSATSGSDEDVRGERRGR
ncbi:UNVERIFIED_CONTAM: hypothetical protein HHA_279320 [Hammondia hammondi]|eukprot:XP_008887715.1 hypothetical protein HHA_279320 [Hammondia hammondi]